MREGHGVEQRKDGSWYNGDWSRDQREGFGKQKDSDGRIYEGYWSNNIPHGQGTFILGGYKYIGQWVEGTKHGQGKEVWTRQADPELEEYQGEFTCGCREGYGTMKYRNGSTFKGYWR